MFTGIIEEIGKIGQIKSSKDFLSVSVKAGLISKLEVGDSLCVNGVCLTVSRKDKDEAWLDVGKETLSRSTLSKLKRGDKVNLESSLTLSKPVGGHLVYGHVDAVGKISKVKRTGPGIEIGISFPRQISKYIAEKGSISVDGVSLTVTKVDKSSFNVFLVPQTLKGTILGDKKAGGSVNLEADIIARYAEKAGKKESKVDMDLLRESGFVR